jgi:acyl-CoA thioester hydrolase
MDAALQAEFGVEGSWPMLRRHRIRWAECDLYAHVNHAAYLTLFEDLRVAYWLEFNRFGTDTPGPVVGRLEVRYVKAAGFDDEVLLGCRTVALRRTSFTHEYAMWRKDGLVCSARAVCVVIRNDTGEKLPIPENLRRAMIERDGAAVEA